VSDRANAASFQPRPSLVVHVDAHHQRSHPCDAPDPVNASCCNAARGTLTIVVLDVRVGVEVQQLLQRLELLPVLKAQKMKGGTALKGQEARGVRLPSHAERLGVRVHLDTLHIDVTVVFHQPVQRLGRTKVAVRLGLRTRAHGTRSCL
jgi:hypothetical protein